MSTPTAAQNLHAESAGPGHQPLGADSSLRPLTSHRVALVLTPFGPQLSIDHKSTVRNMLTAVSPYSPGPLAPALLPCHLKKPVKLRNIAQGKGINPLMYGGNQGAAKGIVPGLP